MAAPIKILFLGDARGELTGLIKKAEQVHKKSGPFSAAFCIGRLLDDNGGISLPSEHQSITPPSFPIYFLGAGAGGILPPSIEGIANLHYLGRSGLAKVADLNVAFLDGSQPHDHQGLQDQDQLEGQGQGQGQVPVVSRHMFTRADVDHLRQKVEAMEGEVDLLLTCQWPAGITQGLESYGTTAAPPEHLGQAYGSKTISEVASLARPRYHVAGGEEVSFARLPYFHRDLGAGTRVTRFVALGPMAGKAKSLHALNLVPSCHMDPDSLAAKPDICTPSPLEPPQPMVISKGLKGGYGEGGVNPNPNPGDWRWQQQPQKRARVEHKAIPNTSNVPQDDKASIIARNVPFAAGEDDLRPFFEQRGGRVVSMFRGTNQEGRLNSWMKVQFATADEANEACRSIHGAPLMGREVGVEMARERDPNTTQQQQQQPGATDTCWFCLGSSNADVGLVASVGEEAYLALDKGAINPTHVLLVPIDHARCSAELTPSAFSEVERYLSALSKCYAAQGLELIAFERYLSLRKSAGGGGNHAHINVLGVPSEAAKGARGAFERALVASGLGLGEGYQVLEMGQGAGSSVVQLSLKGALASAPGGGGGGGGGGVEYFMAILPGGVRLIRPIVRGERWPMNLGREVLAELVEVPGRADWKACIESGEGGGEKAVEEFKKTFAAFDPASS